MWKNKKYEKPFLTYNVKGHTMLKNNEVSGSVCLFSMEYKFLFKEEVESARKVIKKSLKKEGFLVTRVVGFWNMTKKPLQVRMGKGKGKVIGQVCRVYPGFILFLIKNIVRKKAIIALELGSQKLSVKTKVHCFENILG